MPRFILSLLAALSFLAAEASQSQVVVQTGRYTAVYAVPTDAQRDPLQTIVTVSFPKDIETVGQAVNYLLVDTGYSISDALYWDVEVFELVRHPLPAIQRELGPLTILDAIWTIVGPAFTVSINAIDRSVAVEIVSVPAEEPVLPQEVNEKGRQRHGR
jgi:type IV pili sensor histidine kinase/response regulator